MGRRREPRIAEVVRVRVRGVDRNGNPFVQDAHTVDISRRGARLDWVSCLKGLGQTIEVQRGWEKARFRVVWIGQIGTPQDSQIGIFSLEPGNYIWGVTLPPGEGRHLPAGPMRSGEGGGDPSGLRRSPLDGRTRRRHPRYRCTGWAEVRHEGGQIALTGALSDISLGGCYVEMTWPLSSNTRVELVVRAAELEVRAKGIVRFSHPFLGMGIAFTEMRDEDRERLQELTHRLAASQTVEEEERRTRPETPPLGPR